MRYPALCRALNDSVWAIVPEKMDAMLGVLDLRLRGLSLDAATLEKLAATNRNGAQPTMNRSVAVLPVYGTICQRLGLLDEASGGCSTESVGRQFDALLKDEAVGCIILDIDSPGGQLAGVPELADKIFAARGQKPICGVANSLCASAAYWIGTACDELCITPSGEAGSHGVFAVHVDQSKWNEETGVKPTYVSYGRYKTEFNADSPLSAEALAELQRRVDDVGEMFTKALARNRGVPPQTVREKFGQGRCFGAKECVERGMADRIETLDQAIARYAAGGRGSRGGKKAAIERERLKLERYRS